MKRCRIDIMNRTIRLLCILALLVPLGVPARAADVLQEITVKEGDTLWGVANFYLKDPQRWPEILKYNKLPATDLNVILPGMKLRVPILLIKEHLRAAHLVAVVNDVRYRRKSRAEWQKAELDMELYNEDGLRTLQQSKARVKFPSGETLQMDENSLIILKPEQKQEEIDLLSGGVRASRTKILTSQTNVNPRIEAHGAAPDFRTKVKEDKTTLVEVYDGIVDVTAQGKTVTLTKGFGTEVKFKQPPSLPTVLPPRPDVNIATPTEMPGSHITATGQVSSGTLELAVKPPSAAAARPAASSPASGQEKAQVLSQIVSKYHIQVSTSFQFTSTVMDETRPLKDKVSLDFKKNQLPDGIYYYRIAYQDDLGFEGGFSNPVQFTVDATPPALEIISPVNDAEIDTEFINVEGTSEPNVKVLVNNEAATVDDAGRFVAAVMPVKGRNQITVIASDRAGNLSKKEILVDKVKVASKKAAVAATEKKVKEKGMTIAGFALGTLTTMVILGVLLLILQ